MIPYLVSKARLRELGYMTGSRKWCAFWDGHRARARGDAMEVCPIPDATDAERARGRRTPQLRIAWLLGYGLLSESSKTLHNRRTLKRLNRWLAGFTCRGERVSVRLADRGRNREFIDVLFADGTVEKRVRMSNVEQDPESS